MAGSRVPCLRLPWACLLSRCRSCSKHGTRLFQQARGLKALGRRESFLLTAGGKRGSFDVADAQPSQPSPAEGNQEHFTLPQLAAPAYRLRCDYNACPYDSMQDDSR